MDSDKISQPPPMIHKKTSKIDGQICHKKSIREHKPRNIACSKCYNVKSRRRLELGPSELASNACCPLPLGTSAASRLKRMLKVGSG